VHAWLIGLDAEADRAGEVLAGYERDRAASYLLPLDGARFAASRAALRRILAGYVGRAPRNLEFLADRRGRPVLIGHDLHFSLARSGALALLAISPSPVGADLERIEPRPGLADLAAAGFGPGEAACVARGCAGSLLRGFYRHWTAKEAFLKAIGCGLGGFGEAELDCSGTPAIWFRGTPAAGWALSMIEVPAGYAAAIVASQPVTQWRRLPA